METMWTSRIWMAFTDNVKFRGYAHSLRGTCASCNPAPTESCLKHNVKSWWLNVTVIDTNEPLGTCTLPLPSVWTLQFRSCFYFEVNHNMLWQMEWAYSSLHKPQFTRKQSSVNHGFQANYGLHKTVIACFKSESIRAYYLCLQIASCIY